MLIAPADEHAVIADPAIAVIGLAIVSVFVETTGLQGGFPYAVKVRVTLPAVISAALGL